MPTRAQLQAARRARARRSAQIVRSVQRYADVLKPATLARLEARYAPGKRFRLDAPVSVALARADARRERAGAKVISQRLLTEELARLDREAGEVRAQRARRQTAPREEPQDVLGAVEVGPLSRFADDVRDKRERWRARQLAPVDNYANKNVQLRVLVHLYGGKHPITDWPQVNLITLRESGAQQGKLIRRGSPGFALLNSLFDPSKYPDSELPEVEYFELIGEEPLDLDSPVHDPLELPNHRSGVFIPSPFLNHTLNPHAKFTERVCTNTVYHNSCGVEIMMHWRKDIEKHHKLQCIRGEFTVRALFRVLGRTDYQERYEQDPSDIPVSMLNLVAFCAAFRLVLRVFDQRGKRMFSYSPIMHGRTINRNMPSSLYVVWAHGHIQRIAKKHVDSLSKRAGMHDDKTCELAFHALTPSGGGLMADTRYYIPDYENAPERSAVLVRGVGELWDVIREAELAYSRKPQPTRVTVHSTVNVDFLFFQFAHIGHFLLPELDANRNVKRIVYQQEDLTINICDARLLDLGQPGFQLTDAYYRDYLRLQTELDSQLICKQNLSHYSESVQALFEEHSRTALCGLLGTLNESASYYKIDIAKCYTAAIRKQSHLPVFGRFDEYVPYDGHAIEDYTLYTVRLKRKATGIWLIKYNLSVNACFGRTVREDVAAGLVEVLGFARPHRLRANPMPRLIEKVYRSSLQPAHQKFLVNATIGKCGKRVRRKCESLVFQTRDEALAAYDEHDLAATLVVRRHSDLATICLDQEREEVREAIQPAMTVQQAACGDYSVLELEQPLYFVQRSAQAALREGFYPIQHLIYDDTRDVMFRLAQRLEAGNWRVAGIRTDCLYLTRRDSRSVHHVEPVPPRTPEERLASIGTERFEGLVEDPAHNMPRTRIELLATPEPQHCTQSYRRFSTDAEREWRTSDAWQDEAFRFIDENHRVLVKGVCAGSGKTTTILRYLHARGLLGKTLVALPDNATALDMRQRCASDFPGAQPRVCTLHKLLGIAIDDNLQERAQKADACEGMDVLVLDECFKYPTSMLRRLQDFLASRQQLRVIGAGDVLQLEPLDDPLDNVPDPRAYRERAVSSLFDFAELHLRCPKRYATVEDERLVAAIKSALFERGVAPASLPAALGLELADFDEKAFPADAQCITLSNRTRERMERLVNGKQVPAGRQVPGCALRFAEGMRLLSRKRIELPGKKVIQKNYVLELAVLGKDKVKLVEPLEGAEFWLPLAKLQHFGIPSVATGYSRQGQTLEGRVAIFDLQSPMMSAEWLYVALTRNRRVRDNVFYVRPSMPIDWL